MSELGFGQIIVPYLKGMFELEKFLRKENYTLSLVFKVNTSIPTLTLFEIALQCNITFCLFI